MSVGKSFERELFTSFKSEFSTAWVHRNTDAVYGAAQSVKSAPDINVQGNGWSLLIEAKAVGYDKKSGRQLPIGFNRLQEHQRIDLLCFDDTWPRAFGLVAVLYYDALAKRKGGTYRSWLIPIGEWDSLESSLGRKSLPMSVLESYIPETEMAWVPGSGWSIRPAVQYLVDNN